MKLLYQFLSKVFVGLCGFSVYAHNISLKINFKLKVLHSGKCCLVIINYHQLVDGEGGPHIGTIAVNVLNNE
jgi:hypothetical protein